MHTYISLRNDLEKLGIPQDGTLLIHSSMKSIGDVEGRADTVLDVFMDYFKEAGLLVFPTLTWSNVNAEQPVFNVRETPSVVGILPQLFRQRPGVIRSLHPTHSLAAWGREAAAFTEGHERFDSPACEFSPWRRLVGYKAQILFLGASIAHNTFLHGVEEWGHAANVLTEEKQNLISIDYDGKAHAVPSRRHQGNHSTFYDRMEPHFRRIGALREGRFGDAHCVILDAPKIAYYTMEMLSKYPAAFNREWLDEHPRFFQEYLEG